MCAKALRELLLFANTGQLRSEQQKWTPSQWEASVIVTGPESLNLVHCDAGHAWGRLAERGWDHLV